MYLIYQDEKGIKVARKDGRLDEYTHYYQESGDAVSWLLVNSVNNFEVVENDAPIQKIKLN